jgi:plasmid stabilization system protein ParE
MRFYERERPGLGRDFAAQVEETFLRIRANPDAGRLITPQVRRRFLKGFPYAVLYALPPDAVRVVAVAHLSRRSNYWINRR